MKAATVEFSSEQTLVNELNELLESNESAALISRCETLLLLC